MPPFRPIARNGLHLASLLLTGWALVATSYVPPPATDCFSNVPNPAAIQITLGPIFDPADAGPASSDGGSDATDNAEAGPASADGAADDTSTGPNADAANLNAGDAGDSATPTGSGSSGAGAGATLSCNGIDGLMPGAPLILDIFQGKRPDANTCFGFTTRDVRSLPKGTFAITSTPPGWESQTTFTMAQGEFTSTKALACRGLWSLEIHPQVRFPPAKLVSPFDASLSDVWLVTRKIDVAQAQFCDGAFPTAGGVFCEDVFVASSITMAAP